MTIVFVSPFFYPEAISTGRYNTTLAQALVQRGEHVEVLASHPVYPAWRPEYSEAQLPGMHVRRGGAWLRYPRRPLLRRLLLESWYALYASLLLIRLRKRAHRVAIVFPPSLVAMPLRWIVPKGASIVGIVHDLQGVHAGQKVGVVGRLFCWLISVIERRAFAACDRLVFLSHSMAECAVSEYGLARERCVVHYPFLTLAPRISGRRNQLSSILPDDQTHVVYSGALGDKQDPDRLVACMLNLVQQNPMLRCHVFSAGPHFERLRATKAGGGVAFHPLVPEDALEELYARSSLQLLPQAAGTSDGSLPSKLPNLLAAGVPVFAICDTQSEIVQLLQLAGDGAGDHAGFNDPDLAGRITALMERTKHESRQTRIELQQALVARLFGVEAVVAEIVGN